MTSSYLIKHTHVHVSAPVWGPHGWTQWGHFVKLTQQTSKSHCSSAKMFSPVDGHLIQVFLPEALGQTRQTYTCFTHAPDLFGARSSACKDLVQRWYIPFIALMNCHEMLHWHADSTENFPSSLVPDPQFYFFLHLMKYHDRSHTFTVKFGADMNGSHLPFCRS